jgi:hypothetical protein
MIDIEGRREPIPSQRRSHARRVFASAQCTDRTLFFPCTRLIDWLPAASPRHAQLGRVGHDIGIRAEPMAGSGPMLGIVVGEITT